MASSNDTTQMALNAATDWAKFATAFICLGLLFKPLIIKLWSHITFRQPPNTTSLGDMEIHIPIPEIWLLRMEKGSYYFVGISVIYFGISDAGLGCFFGGYFVLFFLFLVKGNRPTGRGEIAGLVGLGVLLTLIAIGVLLKKAFNVG